MPSSSADANSTNFTNSPGIEPGRKSTLFLAASCSLFCVEALGVAGNLLLVRVMLRSRSVHHSYGLFLITLAFTDTASLLLQAIDNGDELHHYWHAKYVTHPTTLACKLHDFFSSLFTTLSAWLLVSITTERFLVVFYPLRGRMWWKQRRRAVFAGVLVSATAVHLPRFYFVQREGAGFCHFRLGNSTLIPIIFDNVASFFFVYGVPGAVLLVLNLLIILQMRGLLKRSSAARLEETRQRFPFSIGLQVLNGGTSTATLYPPSVGVKTRRDRQRATCILVAISCTYLIMLAPQSIARLYWSLAATSFSSEHLDHLTAILKCYNLYYYGYRFVFQNFTAISYGSNFYTYFIFGKRFRAEVTKLLTSSSSGQSHQTQRSNGHNNFWFLRSPPPVRGDYVEVDMRRRSARCPRLHNGLFVTTR